MYWLYVKQIISYYKLWQNLIYEQNFRTKSYSFPTKLYVGITIVINNNKQYVYEILQLCMKNTSSVILLDIETLSTRKVCLIGTQIM